MLICIAALGAHSLILLLIVGAVNIQPALIFHSRRIGAENIGEKLSVGPVVKHLLPFLAVEFGLLFLMIFVPQLITVPLKWLT